MSEEVEQWKPANAKPVNNRLRNLIILSIIIVAGAFFAGFIPMWSKARANEKELKAIGAEVRELRLLALLANAVIDARRGDYEPARRSASEFFTKLSSPESAALPAPKDQVAAILKQRDELITLLARSDPASAERLTGLYVAFRSSLGRELAPAAPAPAPATNPAPPVALETNSAQPSNQ